MNHIRIYDIPDRPLPQALRSLLEFQDLEEQQRFEFSARLKYIEEITKKINEWVSGAETDFRAFLDRIELDVFINNGAPRSDDSPISSWLIHSLWMSGTRAKAMRAALAPAVAAGIDLAVPNAGADIGKWNVWLAKQNAALSAALTAFYVANNLASVMANLLAIDIMLSSLLAGVSKMRLNPEADG